MSTETVTFETDAETAQAFAAASDEERRKLELLLSLRLRELTSRPSRPLDQIMDEISRNAENRGLTPKLLDSLLKNE
jgi:hypothetical protein